MGFEPKPQGTQQRPSTIWPTLLVVHLTAAGFWIRTEDRLNPGFLHGFDHESVKSVELWPTIMAHCLRETNVGVALNREIVNDSSILVKGSNRCIIQGPREDNYTMPSRPRSTKLNTCCAPLIHLEADLYSKIFVRSITKPRIRRKNSSFSPNLSLSFLAFLGRSGRERIPLLKPP
ncbi:hypothetical protein VNO77_44223 [Canavalia gladiata]|uniref:Uncharacterized protein n=1 Tax=Canavalia gladiata TaxID=3824 RepID=A0AAN9JVM9_CANGL